MVSMHLLGLAINGNAAADRLRVKWSAATALAAYDSKVSMIKFKADWNTVKNPIPRRTEPIIPLKSVSEFLHCFSDYAPDVRYGRYVGLRCPRPHKKTSCKDYGTEHHGRKSCFRDGFETTFRQTAIVKFLIDNVGTSTKSNTEQNG